MNPVGEATVLRQGLAMVAGSRKRSSWVLREVVIIVHGTRTSAFPLDKAGLAPLLALP